MERQQRPGAADWSAFWFGSLIGVALSLTAKSLLAWLIFANVLRT